MISPTLRVPSTSASVAAAAPFRRTMPSGTSKRALPSRSVRSRTPFANAGAAPGSGEDATGERRRVEDRPQDVAFEAQCRDAALLFVRRARVFDHPCERLFDVLGCELDATIEVGEAGAID